MMMNVWTMIISGGLAVFLVLWLLLLSIHLLKLRRQFKRQNSAILQQIEESSVEQTRLRKELHALQLQLQSGLQTTQTELKHVSDNAVQLQSNQAQQLEVLTEINNKVLVMEQESEPNRLYSRAKKMVELGADADELMHECELSRAEAELLLAMQRKSQSA